jgi:hypothetical protein
MPHLAGAPEELTAANATASFLTASSLLLGPALAAVVLAVSNATAVVAIASLMLLAGIPLVLWVAGPRRQRGSSRRVHLLGGVHELRRNGGATVIVLLIVLHAASWGIVDILLVSLAIRELSIGASGVGLLTGAVGLGAVLGGAATIALVRRARLTPALASGVLLWATPVVFVGVPGSTPPVLLFLAAAGAGFSLLDVAGRTLLQRVASDEALGRVFGLLESGFMAAWAVGSAIAPVVLHAVGIGWSFAIAGAVLPIVALAGWPSLRRAEEHAGLPGEELELLRNIELFRPLPEGVLERLARNLRPVRAPAGAIVVREGDVGDLFYVIEDGEVVVSVAGREVARSGPGDYFGEIALLRDVPRQATVTAATETTLLALERAPFLSAVTGSELSSAAAEREMDRRLDASSRSEG